MIHINHRKRRDAANRIGAVELEPKQKIMITKLDDFIEKERKKTEKKESIISAYLKAKEELPNAKKWTIFRIVGESIGISTTYVNQILKEKGVV
ncbi:hypothetical protein [Paraprevotella xylaniphila]|uniref:hypothetical protein n=1 Tax=Paraprevotella xylaniphila TaxID=454155 RepID=UPI003FD7C072